MLNKIKEATDYLLQYTSQCEIGKNKTRRINK